MVHILNFLPKQIVEVAPEHLGELKEVGFEKDVRDFGKDALKHIFELIAEGSVPFEFEEDIVEVVKQLVRLLVVVVHDLLKIQSQLLEITQKVDFAVKDEVVDKEEKVFVELRVVFKEFEGLLCKLKSTLVISESGPTLHLDGEEE